MQARISSRGFGLTQSLQHGRPRARNFLGCSGVALKRKRSLDPQVVMALMSSGPWTHIPDSIHVDGSRGFGWFSGCKYPKTKATGIL